MNTKRLSKIQYAIIGVTILICIVLISRKLSYNKTYSDIFYAMDTVVTVESSNIDSISQLKDITNSLDTTFNGYSIGGELYTLNSKRSLECSNELSNVIQSSIRLSNQYGNGVDITSGALTHLWNITGDTPKKPTSEEISKALSTIGTENVSINGNTITLLNDTILDLGSVAKGYTLDVVKNYLDSVSKVTATYSMGSSTLMYNVKDTTISVRSPNSPEDVFCTFSVSGTAYISTSGGYERYVQIDGIDYQHILDLSTGYPTTTDLTSVTVYSKDSGILTDYLSTKIYLNGTANLEAYLNSTKDYIVIAVDRNDHVYTSKGFTVNIIDDDYTLYNK